MILKINGLNIYRIFHPTAEEYTFFSASQKLSLKYIIFKNIKQVLTNKKIEITYYILSQ
jgi:hypothetical protein